MKEASSFRDPSGFVFYVNKDVYRQINSNYKEHYEYLITSGLYESLINSKLLIPHEEIDSQENFEIKPYKNIKPEKIEFISYPYEWSFSQLKDAALLTLQIQKTAIEYGMILKDASAYNIQFLNGKPILIDTLSLEKYDEGIPWIAYRQFCENFLAPLSLTVYKDAGLAKLLQIYIDGIPLELASRLLPLSSYFNFPLLGHLHCHSKFKVAFGKKQNNSTQLNKVSKEQMVSIINSLENSIMQLNWRHKDSTWSKYYKNSYYLPGTFKHKTEVVSQFLDKVTPSSVLDLGANEGYFSMLTANKNIKTISCDLDPVVVDCNYIECKNRNIKNILPLIVDVMNPSPAIGWSNKERKSFIERTKVDTALVLALLHHLSISNNVSFRYIASFLSDLCNKLIIEFIPKSDSQVQRLLATKKDIFKDYTKLAFELAFKDFFIIKDSMQLTGSERILYLMDKI